MDFVAFDFETANSRSDSACQLAAVSVRSGQIVAERCWTIRPPRLYFSPRNISIHGIRPEQVVDAATMEQLWPELLEFVDGQLLVAHNACFDIGVLVASLAAFDVACPHIEFSCTRAIARRAWPGRSGYGLKPLGNWLGVDFRHHDALEDSRCCARIALAAAASIQAQDFRDLEKRLRLTRGRYSLGRISGPRTVNGRSPLAPRWPSMETATAQPATSSSIAANPSQRRAAAAADARTAGPHSDSAACCEPPAFENRRSPSRGQIDPRAVVEAAAGSQPLSRKRIVCLGNLRGLSMAETQHLLETLGATWQTQIAADTDYVVACGGMRIDEASQAISRSSPAAATSAPSTTAPTIRLISERQFLALLPGGRASVRW